MSSAKFALFFLAVVAVWFNKSDATKLKQDTITCLDNAFSEELAAGLHKKNQGFTTENSRVFVQHFKEDVGQSCQIRLSWAHGEGVKDKSRNPRIIESGSLAQGSGDPQCLKEAERTCAATLLQGFLPAASLSDWTSIGKSWTQLKTAMTNAINIGADCKVDKSKSPPAAPKPVKATVIQCIQKHANAAISKFNAYIGREVFSQESDFIIDYDYRRDYDLLLHKKDITNSQSVRLFKGSENPSIPAIPSVYLDDRTCEDPATMRCANQLLEQFTKAVTKGLNIGVRKTWKELMESMQKDNAFVCK